LLAGDLEDPALFADFVSSGESIAQLYEAREYSKAMREIMKLADRANQYIDERKPWVLAKDESTLPQVQLVCTQGLNLFRVITTYLKPVLPDVASAAESFLATGALTWESRAIPMVGSKINVFETLLTRIDDKTVASIVDASRDTHPQNDAPAATAASAGKISIDEFRNIDLRVANVIQAEEIEGADKLLKITVELGGETRSVFAGIKSAYSPADLIGRQVILVANLEPRKMRFGVSEGMLLAAGPGGDEIFLLGVDPGAKPGMRVS
jgi:methionyl-tRNA synthetase